MTTAGAIAELADAWHGCGIDPGDTVLIHSSARRTIRRYRDQGVPLTPGHIVESFLTSVGRGGTLLLPVFNYGFNRGEGFDIRTTPSEVGAIPEAGRIHSDAIRTGHPVYSFAAIGHDARAFRDVVNYSGYGLDSPFSILKEMGGKIGILDVIERSSMTYYHYVEEMMNVPYRYHKEFAGEYTDCLGHTTTREFGLFVRYIEPDYYVDPDTNPMGELLWQKGLYGGYPPQTGPGLRTISARTLYDEVADVICKGRAEGILYTLMEESELSNEARSGHNRGVQRQ
jgi:aminoglycoside 3-N-acetyltransferase